jgi:hypothetical protein
MRAIQPFKETPVIRLSLAISLFLASFAAFADKYPTPTDGPFSNGDKAEIGFISMPFADCQSENPDAASFPAHSENQETPFKTLSMTLLNATNNQMGIQMEVLTAAKKKISYLIFAPMAVYKGNERTYIYKSGDPLQHLNKAEIKTVVLGSSIRVELSLSSNENKQATTVYSCAMKQLK